MNDEITFFWNDRGVADFRTKNGYFSDLGSQLASDIQKYASDCVDLLVCIDDVTSGRADVRDFEGNSAEFRCDRAGVTITSLGPKADAKTYPFDEARFVVRQYLDFLAPSADEKARAVATWEKENQRVFPGSV